MMNTAKDTKWRRLLCRVFGHRWYHYGDGLTYRARSCYRCPRTEGWRL